GVPHEVGDLPEHLLRAEQQAAEREWRRNAGRACGTPWLRLWRWYESRGLPGSLDRMGQALTPPEEELTARQRVEQAVRIVADDAADGLPAPWAQAVREAAFTGAKGLPEALDELAVNAGAGPAKGSGKSSGKKAGKSSGNASDKTSGTSSGTAAGASHGGGRAGSIGRGGPATGVPLGGRPAKPPRPKWWPAAVLVQASMTLIQIFGGLWLLGQIVGVLEPGLVTPALIMLAGVVGGPLVEWSCAAAIRGPARRYGQDAERRLREAAAACGRARVLDPVSAELVRYREVRERYAAVTEFSTTGR
ncbi:ATP-binding protein, partial [Streptomyces cavourensis]|nr:ATP-binding protein [Streptomyces cavourensis]